MLQPKHWIIFFLQNASNLVYKLSEIFMQKPETWSNILLIVIILSNFIHLRLMITWNNICSDCTLLYQFHFHLASKPLAYKAMHYFIEGDGAITLIMTNYFLLNKYWFIDLYILYVLIYRVIFTCTHGHTLIMIWYKYLYKHV